MYNGHEAWVWTLRDEAEGISIVERPMLPKSVIYLQKEHQKSHTSMTTERTQ